MVKDKKSDSEIIDEAPSAARFGSHLKFLRNAFAPTGKSRDLHVTYIYGPAGTGKTTYAMENTPEDTMFVQTPPDGKIWFDGYTHQSAIVFDDYDPVITCSRNTMRFIDKWRIPLPNKGGTAFPEYSQVFFTSNYPPPTDPAFMRRLTKIIHLTEDGPIDETPHRSTLIPTPPQSNPICEGTEAIAQGGESS